MPQLPAEARQGRADAAADYGFSLAVIRSSKELAKAFEDARKNGWTPQRFLAEIRDTDWFKEHSDAWRKGKTLQLTDPKTYEADMASAVANTRDLAASMGATLDEDTLKRLAKNAYMFGMDAARQRDLLSNYVHVANGGPLKGQYIGDAGKNATALKDAAARNGYKIPKGKLGEWNRAIMAGDASVTDYQAFIRRQAAAAFPSFAAELTAGADLADVASPYTDSMARILEINPAEVNLFDPTVRKALASKNAKTGKPEAMAIYDFEDTLRKDPRWMKTDGAHQEVMGLGRNVLQMMGF